MTRKHENVSAEYCLKKDTIKTIQLARNRNFVGHRPKAYRHPVTVDVGLFSTGYLIGIV